MNSTLILKENDDYILAWKPANLPTTPTKMNPDCLITRLIQEKPYLKSVKGFNKIGEYGLLNRLDNKTAGVVIIAKSDNSFSNLNGNLESLNKIYLAFCYKLGTEKSGTISLPIAHHLTDEKRMVWVPNQEKNAGKHQFRGKILQCETKFELIDEQMAKNLWEKYMGSVVSFPDIQLQNKEPDKYTWIKCTINKGKRHQIRLHLKYMKYPVVGDDLYSKREKSNSLINYYALFGIGIEGL